MGTCQYTVSSEGTFEIDLKRKRTYEIENDRLKEDERALVRSARARKKPYFGRIDFSDQPTTTDEAFYIGSVGITDSSSDSIVVH